LVDSSFNSPGGTIVNAVIVGNLGP